MTLLEEYVCSAMELEKLNQAGLTGKTAKRNNKLADRLREIAATIEVKTPEIKPDFCRLLSHGNSNVRAWCAHHILEVMSCKDEYSRMALAEITARAKDRYGEKLWLDEWYAQHPQDRALS